MAVLLAAVARHPLVPVRQPSAEPRLGASRLVASPRPARRLPAVPRPVDRPRRRAGLPRGPPPASRGGASRLSRRGPVDRLGPDRRRPALSGAHDRLQRLHVRRSPRPVADPGSLVASPSRARGRRGRGGRRRRPQHRDGPRSPGPPARLPAPRGGRSRAPPPRRVDARCRPAPGRRRLARRGSDPPEPRSRFLPGGPRRGPPPGRARRPQPGPAPAPRGARRPASPGGPVVARRPDRARRLCRRLRGDAAVAGCGRRGALSPAAARGRGRGVPLGARLLPAARGDDAPRVSHPVPLDAWGGGAARRGRRCWRPPSCRGARARPAPGCSGPASSRSASGTPRRSRLAGTTRAPTPASVGPFSS